MQGSLLFTDTGPELSLESDTSVGAFSFYQFYTGEV